MDLHFLGVGSAYNPAMKNTSAYLAIGRSMILFDCGETVFESLFNRKRPDHFDEFYVLITHCHSDHVGSLGSFISYCHFCQKKTVHVCFPSEQIVQYLALSGVVGSMYEYIGKPSALTISGLTITSVEVNHDPLIPCYGYLVQTCDYCFFYGGDSTQIPSEITDLLTKNKIDKIYQDTSYEFYCSNNIHGSLEGLCQQIPEEYRHKIVCMHFNHPFADKIEACGFRTAICD